jgi:hypothetical protein
MNDLDVALDNIDEGKKNYNTFHDTWIKRVCVFPFSTDTKKHD